MQYIRTQVDARVYVSRGRVSKFLLGAGFYEKQSRRERRFPLVDHGGIEFILELKLHVGEKTTALKKRRER